MPLVSVDYTLLYKDGRETLDAGCKDAAMQLVPEWCVRRKHFDSHEAELAPLTPACSVDG